MELHFDIYFEHDNVYESAQYCKNRLELPVFNKREN